MKKLFSPSNEKKITLRVILANVLELNNYWEIEFPELNP